MRTVRKLVRSGVPLYLQMAQDLEQAIRQRRYVVGAQLPYEAQLQKDYGVSKFTVREALKRLEAKGLVEKRHGIGTIVIARSESRPINYSVSDIDEFIRTAQQARFKKLIAEERALMAHEAEPFALPLDEVFAVIKGQRVLPSTVDKTIAYVKVYVPHRYAAVVEAIGATHGLISTLIEQRFGVTLDVIRQEIAAPFVPVHTRAELEAAGMEVASERTLVCRRWYLDTNGELMLCTENLFVDPDFSFNTVLSRTRQS